MPTLVQHTVDTAGGGDYTSLSAWESAQQRNLVSLDEIEEVSCTGGADAGGATTVTGWTTDSTRYPIVKAASGDEAGSVWSTSIYRGPRISVAQDYVRVQDLQAVGGGSGVQHVMGANTGIRFTRCYLRNSNLVMTVNASIDGLLANCILENTGTAGNALSGTLNAGFGQSVRVYNCTIYGYVTAIAASTASGSPWYVKNTIGIGETGTDFTGGTAFNSASTNNLSTDTSAPGSNAVTSASESFPAGDFTLTGSTCASAIGAGTDLSADSFYAFTDDINRDTRISWDIGADSVPRTTSDLSVTAEFLSTTEAGLAVTAEFLESGSASMSLTAEFLLTLGVKAQVVYAEHLLAFEADREIPAEHLLIGVPADLALTAEHLLQLSPPASMQLTAEHLIVIGTKDQELYFVFTGNEDLTFARRFFVDVGEDSRAVSAEVGADTRRVYAIIEDDTRTP